MTRPDCEEHTNGGCDCCRQPCADDRIEQAKRDLDAIRGETDCPWISGFFTCDVFTSQADRIEALITSLVAENERLEAERDEWKAKYQYERDVWDYDGRLEEAEAERDEWQAIARVLAHVLTESDTEWYELGGVTMQPYEVAKSMWLTWAREQLSYDATYTQVGDNSITNAACEYVPITSVCDRSVVEGSQVPTQSPSSLGGDSTFGSDGENREGSHGE